MAGNKALVLVGLFTVLTATTPLRAAEELRDEIEQFLRKGILEVWFPRSLDREHGGFLCDFDYQWQPTGAQRKTIVFQSRLTWLATTPTPFNWPGTPSTGWIARRTTPTPGATTNS